MSEVGKAESMVFASSQIPKDNPSSVELKGDFKKGDVIWFRPFFAKPLGTLGDWASNSDAQYDYRLFKDGEKMHFARQPFGNQFSIKDRVTMQDEVTKWFKAQLESLPKGKHKIKLQVVMNIANPNKVLELQRSGSKLEIRDASGTVDGPVAASGEFTYTV